MKLLIVDDDPDYARMLQQYLRYDIDAEISAVASGEAAITLIMAESFDLIVCDYNTSGMNGHDVFRDWQAMRSPGQFILWTNEDLTNLPPFNDPST